MFIVFCLCLKKVIDFLVLCVCVCVQLFNTQAQSLLLMTSVAMPVFSKKKETVRPTVIIYF